ncbi:MAG TPA: PIN domain-containing protein [Thermoanaerobaculia bacterium]|nr:PIN domain-containing protein [Thermoanaerobaculia bacterium]
MPEPAIFLDTNGWLALLNRSDALHFRATGLWRRLGDLGARVVVTDWVIAETGNGLARSPARQTFGSAVDRLRESTAATIVKIDESLLLRALALFGRRRDKTWGLVDCASFVVMEDHEVRRAFTNDRHFEQAGFVAILRDQQDQPRNPR